MDGITDSMDVSLSKLQEIVKDRACCCPWRHKESDMTEQLNNNIVCLEVTAENINDPEEGLGVGWGQLASPGFLMSSSFAAATT